VTRTVRCQHVGDAGHRQRQGSSDGAGLQARRPTGRRPPGDASPAVSPTVVLREASAPPPTVTAWTGSPSARSACTASLPAGWLPAAACVRPGAVAGDRGLPGAAL